MTMQKIKSLTFSLALVGLTGGASSLCAADEAEVAYKPFTLGVDAGTLGLGVSAKWRYWHYFGAHVGVNYLNYEDDGYDIEGINYDAKLRLFSGEIGFFDIYPWKNQSLRISLGVLINQNELKGFSPSTGAGTFVTLGGTSVDSGAVGDISMKAEQETFSPFLSLGGDIPLNRSKSLSLGFEVGVAYTGSPEVSMSATSGATFSTLLAAEAKEVEDWADDFKFYPIVKVSLNFSF